MTNLFNRLKSTHRVIHDQVVKEQKNSKMKSSSTPVPATQSSIKDTLYSATAYPPSSHKHKELTDAITYMIAKDMFPINTISDPGFSKLINILDKQYVLPLVTISAELRCLPFMRNVMEKLQEKCQQHYILPPQGTMVPG